MERGVITALEVQKRDKKRVNVFVDGDYAFSLSLDEAARLHKGQVLTEAEIDALRTNDEIVRAVDRAARFIAYRPRSEQEVRRNLRDKDVPDPVIDAAMERLRQLGYLDDRAFAEFWVKNRSQFKPSSDRALRYELRQKGVPDRVIAEVLAEQDNDDAAYRAAQSQIRRLRGLSKRDFRVKLNGFLQRRGFSYSDARSAIEQFIEELERDDPDYFAGEGPDDEADWYGE
ncbi:MAG: RecX family transcriptional regulator [Chloroflexota bacterium]|nr:MAG: RecX family transcriptional regulator [Chloroflexota bacterium]